MGRSLSFQVIAVSLPASCLLVAALAAKVIVTLAAFLLVSLHLIQTTRKTRFSDSVHRQPGCSVSVLSAQYRNLVGFERAERCCSYDPDCAVTSVFGYVFRYWLSGALRRQAPNMARWSITRSTDRCQAGIKTLADYSSKSAGW